MCTSHMPATTIAMPSAAATDTDSPSQATAMNGRKAGVERTIG